MKGFCLQILMIGCTLLVSGASYIHAQELQAKITINHAQISGTDNAVFDNLQQTLERFVNERQWTHLQFQKNERINCNFNLTVPDFAAGSITQKILLSFVAPSASEPS